MPVQVPYIGDKIFPSLEYWDMVIEKRTGVSRSTMALDLDTLQHQTATAVNAQQSPLLSPKWRHTPETSPNAVASKSCFQSS